MKPIDPFVVEVLGAVLSASIRPKIATKVATTNQDITVLTMIFLNLMLMGGHVGPPISIKSLIKCEWISPVVSWQA